MSHCNNFPFMPYGLSFLLNLYAKDSRMLWKYHKRPQPLIWPFAKAMQILWYNSINWWDVEWPDTNPDWDLFNNNHIIVNIFKHKQNTCIYIYYITWWFWQTRTQQFFAYYILWYHVSESLFKMNTQEYTEPLMKRRIYNVATI